jgi:hypothetical protein
MPSSSGFHLNCQQTKQIVISRNKLFGLIANPTISMKENAEYVPGAIGKSTLIMSALLAETLFQFHLFF